MEIKTHFSLEQLCEAVHTDLTAPLGNACKTVYSNIVGDDHNSCIGALEQETRDSFKDVMLRQAHLPKAPVNLFVAQSHLRIDSVSAPLFSQRDRN